MLKLFRGLLFDDIDIYIFDMIDTLVVLPVRPTDPSEARLHQVGKEKKGLSVLFGCACISGHS